MRQVYLIGFVFLFLLMSCGGGDDSGSTPIPVVISDPKASTLVFPANNTECNEGVVINDNSSRVTFRWNASEDTDSYEVNIRNLNTNATFKVPSTTAQAEITIERGVPYEWFVISKANGTQVTASSSKFKFYNQGPGIDNYAPFPAEAVAPMRGATIANTTTVSLEWKGSDIDDDIVEFEVLFGTNTKPSAPIGTTAAETLDAAVVSGIVYYWKVITTDSQGNSSSSEIFEFKVGN